MRVTRESPILAEPRSHVGCRIVALDAFDIRFPTSAGLDGSDAMNPDPDYSAAYVILRTNDRRRRRKDTG